VNSVNWMTLCPYVRTGCGLVVVNLAVNCYYFVMYEPSCEMLLFCDVVLCFQFVIYECPS
jgi:hypothetical protein